MKPVRPLVRLGTIGARVGLAALLVLAAAPAVRAADLSGLWQLEGHLSDHTGFSGLAVLTPESGGRYRLAARGQTAAGKALSWRADAAPAGQTVALTWRSLTGLTGAHTGASAATESLSLSPAADAFSGAAHLGGTGATAFVRFTRRAAPQVSFQPASLSVAVGGQAQATVQVDPAAALDLLSLTGAHHGALTARRHKDTVTVHGLQAGSYRIEVHLGSGGAVLARLPVVVRTDLLGQVVARVRAEVAAHHPPLVVFDLDDTLFDNAYRTWTILRAYGTAHHEPRLTSLPVGDVAYSLDATLANAGLSPAEVSGALGRAVRGYWSPRFFGSGYYGLDAAEPGSVAYVKRLVSAGATIVYVTGRRTSERASTLSALKECGFPTQGTTLYLKPSTHGLTTAAYKEDVARTDLPHLGVAVAAFDNEPANCNAFHRALPGAIVVHLETIWSPGAPALDPGIQEVPDYR